MSSIRIASMAAAVLIAAPPPVAAQPAVQTIVLTSFDYAPKPIHLRAGRPVTLTFVNRSGSGHDFTAKAFFRSARLVAGSAPGGEVELRPGESRSITLVPSAGSYPVHCSHFLHRQFGMVDQILVD